MLGPILLRMKNLVL